MKRPSNGSTTDPIPNCARCESIRPIRAKICNLTPRRSIAEKRLADWIQSFVLWCHDQCGAMGRFEFCVLDKKEDMVTGMCVQVVLS